MKKYFVLIFSLALFLVNTTIRVNADTSSTINGTVVNDLQATFNKADTATSTLNTIKEIANEDSNVHLTISNDSIIIDEYMTPSNNVTLKLDNQQVTVNNGNYHATVQNNGKNIQYSVKDTGTSVDDGTIAANKTHAQIVNVISYSKMIGYMDSMNNNISLKNQSSSNSILNKVFNIFSTTAEASSIRYNGQSSGQYVYSGTHVHCNRFNGIHSNHRYYSRLSGQGWVNYYKSDCWLLVQTLCL